MRQREQVTPGRRDAKHSVVLGDLGIVTVEEQLGSTEICLRNPREQLLWTDNANGTVSMIVNGSRKLSNCAASTRYIRTSASPNANNIFEELST